MTIEEEMKEIEEHHGLARNSIDGYRAIQDMRRLVEMVRELRTSTEQMTERCGEAYAFIGWCWAVFYAEWPQHPGEDEFQEIMDKLCLDPQKDKEQIESSPIEPESNDSSD